MNDPFAARVLDPALLAQVLAVGLLLCARLAPLAWLVPWASARPAPVLASVATIVVLALCLWPAAASAPVLPLSGPTLIMLGVREALIGVVYALSLALPLRLLEWAGRLAGRFSGAPGADAAFGSLQLWLGLAAFFTLGGHRLAIAALSDAIVERPLGAPSALGDLGGVALGSAQLLGDAFASALLIALPVAAALVLSDLGVALAGRSAGVAALPFALAPVRAALALLVVGVSIVLLLDSMPAGFTQGLRSARRLWGLP